MTQALLFTCPLKIPGVLTNCGMRDEPLPAVSTEAEEAIHPRQVHGKKVLPTELTNAMQSEILMTLKPVNGT